LKHTCPFCFGTFDTKEILFQDTLFDSRNHSENLDESQLTDDLTGDLVFGAPRIDKEYQTFLSDFQHAKAFKKRHILYKIDTGDIPQNEVQPIVPVKSGEIDGNIAKTLFGIADDIVPKATENIRDGYGEVTFWENEKLRIPSAIRKYKDHKACIDKVCPHCHCSIPDNFLGVPEEQIQSVAFAGGTSAGKTQFMVAVLQDLDIMLDRLGYGKVDIAAESKVFFEILNQQFIKNGRPDATPGDKPLFPMIIQVTPTFTGMLGKMTTVIFYDIPGEYANNPRIMLDQREGLRTAETLLYIIDPHQFVSALTTASDMYDRNLATPLSNLAKFNICQKVRRVAVVVSKADLLIHQKILKVRTNSEFNDGDPAGMDDMSMHKEAVDLKTMDDIHNNIEYLIEGEHRCYRWENKIASFVHPAMRERQEKEKKALEEKIRNFTPKEHKKWEKLHKKDPVCEDNQFSSPPPLPVRYFAVSTYQWVASAGERKMIECREGGLRRHRIIEPLLYLLAEWKVINSK
jgi:hypothetical protein